jgi:predicted regulator of Ras-like GTPase activity (Roadblock/LC7/MglB family)
MGKWAFGAPTPLPDEPEEPPVRTLLRRVWVMSKADQLAAGLDDFLSVSPEVEAAAVVSADGLPMASALPPYVEEDRLAAMSAALLTLGERAASGLGKGKLAQVFVEADEGYVVLMAAGSNAVLVAVTSGAAKIGLVLFEMRRAAASIVEIMASGPPVEVATNGAHDAYPGAADLPAPPPLIPETTTTSESTFSTWH